MLKKNFENGTTFVFAGCSTVYHLAKADRKRKETLTTEENYCTPISVHVFPVKNEKLFKEWKSAFLSWILRSVQTMQLCSLGQGTVSPWSLVSRCPRVLQVLPTMHRLDRPLHTLKKTKIHFCQLHFKESDYKEGGIFMRSS